MAKRIITKIGDVFVVPISETTQKYMQYIANDLYQLNSSVIRAFKESYPLDSTPDLEEVVSGEVDFFAHVSLRGGIEDGLWQKIEKASLTGNVNPLFRGSMDSGKGPGIEYSSKWYIWRLQDENPTHVGELTGENRQADIGVVVRSKDIPHRMKTGEYLFKYPKFK